MRNRYPADETYIRKFAGTLPYLKSQRCSLTFGNVFRFGYDMFCKVM